MIDCSFYFILHGSSCYYSVLCFEAFFEYNIYTLSMDPGDQSILFCDNIFVAYKCLIFVLVVFILLSIYDPFIALYIILHIYGISISISLLEIGFVTDHAKLQKMHSQLYLHLSIFEHDPKRKLAMHTRRQEMLAPLLAALSVSSFDVLHKEVCVKISLFYIIFISYAAVKLRNMV